MLGVKLSNGHEFKYMVGSGALGFDGKGWFWEWPLVWLGLIQLELFTIVLRTITYDPLLYPKSNLSWWRVWTWLPWSPWSCVRFLKGNGAHNKVGLYNPGIDYFIKYIAPRLDFKKYKLVASIFGTGPQLVEMAFRLNQFDFVAVEINDSCPNVQHEEEVETIIRDVKRVKKVSCHPLIIKLNVSQDYRAIARGLVGIAEAVSLNSVPWKMLYPDEESPMSKIGKPGSGDGGVSGGPAQVLNWKAVEQLGRDKALPVLAPGVMKYEDISHVEFLGARGVVFSSVHLREPWAPTAMVKRHIKLTSIKPQV